MLLATFLLAGQALAQTAPATFTYIHNFSTANKTGPSSLIQGSDGNFYGTTNEAGTTNPSGTVFELTPAGTLTTLYTFTGGSDGDSPYSLVQGSDGNFYGATALHYNEATKISTLGTIFKITPAGALTTLHQFANSTGDGSEAIAIIQGSDGNLYGTTDGGVNATGTVFQLTTAGDFTTLYNFDATDDATDDNFANGNGADPDGALIQGSDGNFYGTTSRGGPDAVGTVFQITSTGAFKSLYQFKATDSYYPDGLVQGADGNFYGQTGVSSVSEYGSIFQLTPAGVLTTVHIFNVADGAYPQGPLVLGSGGDIYGSTYQGGANGYGTVFQMNTSGALTTLHDYDPYESYATPTALFLGIDGDFYGARSIYGRGTVFRLSLKPSFFAGQVDAGGDAELPTYFLQFPGGNYFGVVASS